MQNLPNSGSGSEHSPEEILELCWRLADDKKAEDAVALDLRGISGFADYFLIVSGNSEPHLKAIADGIGKGLKERGLRPRSVEGIPLSHWIVMDCGALLIHIFHPDTRRHYALEQLWNDASRIQIDPAGAGFSAIPTQEPVVDDHD